MSICNSSGWLPGPTPSSRTRFHTGHTCTHTRAHTRPCAHTCGTYLSTWTSASFVSALEGPPPLIPLLPLVRRLSTGSISWSNSLFWLSWGAPPVLFLVGSWPGGLGARLLVFESEPASCLLSWVCWGPLPGPVVPSTAGMCSLLADDW